MDSSLTLPEELLLLALHDEKGTVAFGSMLPYALGGAILAELLLRGHIEIDHGRGRDLVTRVGTADTGDAVLDEALERIRTASRRSRAETWVSRLAGIRGLRERIAGALCRHGVLEEREERILLLFSRRVYPTINPEPEKRLVERIRAAVLEESAVPDARSAILIALAKSADLLGTVLTSTERKAGRERIEAIAEGSVTGAATQQAIAAVQVALIAASTVVIVTSAGR